MSRTKGKLFTDHDLTHVIFGCDTSIVSELMLKPWILLGCNISMDELKEYAADPDVQRLNKEERLGWGHIQPSEIAIAAVGADPTRQAPVN